MKNEKSTPKASARKNTRYSPGEVEDIVAQYLEVVEKDYETRSAVVSRLAEQYQAPETSIRAVLGRQKVYRRKVYTTKRGHLPATRERLVQLLEDALELRPDTLKSMVDVNKGELIKLLEAFIRKTPGDWERLDKIIRAEG
jgi:septation ring formation regulator EzrA